jgi:hypothetical protein
MQTFLPYPNFKKSLACLDNKRLGKQRVEALQLYNDKYTNHPCYTMWADHKDALALYINICLDEWEERGFKNSLVSKIKINKSIMNIIIPDWVNDPRLNVSHQANLLDKDYEFYKKYNWNVKPHSGYWWPVEVKGDKTKKDIEFWNEKFKNKT